MDLFSCNNCRRCRRRRRTCSSSGDDDNDVDRRRRNSGTNLRRERVAVDDCCAAAAMYFYAAQRRRRPQSEMGAVPLESSELTGTRGVGARASILKKPGDDSPVSVSAAVGGARRSPSVADKRASFNEAVDVIVADDSGRPVVADSVRLKPEVDLSSAFVAHASAADGAAASQQRAKQAFAMMVFPAASRCRHAFQLASTDVERRPDGSRYLRAVIRPAEDDGGGDTGRGGDGRRTRTRDERVVVRAAGRGSRLVVGAYRPEPLGDGTNYLRQVRSFYAMTC